MFKTADPSYVISRIIYNPETGKMYWRKKKERSATDAAWNRRFAGKEAANSPNRGYLRVCIKGSMYKAHRIAFVLMTGRWPANMIDHLNGDSMDNRWGNLREATISENNINILPTKGIFKGVRYNPASWEVDITTNRKRYRRRFPTFEEAVAHYNENAPAVHRAFSPSPERY